MLLNREKVPMAFWWIDEDRIQLLVYDRTAWEGDCSVLDLLRQLEELDYITLREYDNEADYLSHVKE